MNSFVLVAEVSQQPETRYTQNQDLMAQVILSFDDNGALAYIKGEAYKKSADLVARLSLGDKVIVSGNIKSYTIDRPEGFKERQVNMVIRSVEVINGGSKAATTTATATATIGGTALTAAESNVICVEESQVNNNVATAPQFVSTASVPANVATYPAVDSVAEEVDDIPF